jgi:ectoine hydroxylase-related dioxygenase (phytanoyl-CoA dioxygenase family)
MSEKLVELAAARGSRLARTPLAHPLSAEIAEALMSLSGEAHRDVVISRIAQARHRDAKVASPALRDEILTTFDAHCRAGEAPGLFRLVFGPGSHRWALTPQARMFLETRGEA